MNAIELREQHDALLLVGIRAGNNRNAALRRAEVMGQMRHTGRDVDKVPGPSRELFFEPLAIPHAGFAAENIDGGFVTIVLVAFARPPGGMVTTCKWIACASTDSAEIPGAYKSACLPKNSAPGRTTRQVGILPSRLAVSVLVSIVINGVRLPGVRSNKTPRF